MRNKLFYIFALMCLASAVAFAQQPPPAPPPPGEDPIGRSLFPPELVMQNQEAISLSDDQRTYLKTEIRQAQVKFTEWQWKLQDEAEKMVALIKQPHPDETQVLAQLEKVLSVEREIKRAQIALLLRIKNKLTPDQQAKLEELRGRQGR